jgi:hypothetical protein
MPLLKTSVGANASVGTGASANKAGGAGRQVKSPGGWHPTVLYMLGLTVLEIVAVAMLSRHLLK